MCVFIVDLRYKKKHHHSKIWNWNGTQCLLSSSWNINEEDLVQFERLVFCQFKRFVLLLLLKFVHYFHGFCRQPDNQTEIFDIIDDDDEEFIEKFLFILQQCFIKTWNFLIFFLIMEKIFPVKHFWSIFENKTKKLK